MDVGPCHTLERWHLLVLSFSPYPARGSYLHLRARVAHRLVAVSFTPSHTAPPDVLKEQQFLQLFSTICEATEKPKPQHYGTLLPTSATERVAGMTCLSFHQNNPNISCMKRRSQSQSLLLLMEPLAGKSVQTLYQCSAVWNPQILRWNCKKGSTEQSREHRRCVSCSSAPCASCPCTPKCCRWNWRGPSNRQQGQVTAGTCFSGGAAERKSAPRLLVSTEGKSSLTKRGRTRELVRDTHGQTAPPAGRSRRAGARPGWRAVPASPAPPPPPWASPRCCGSAGRGCSGPSSARSAGAGGAAAAASLRRAPRCASAAPRASGGTRRPRVGGGRRWRARGAGPGGDAARRGAGLTEFLPAVPQLLYGGKLDFLVFDYLSEITMSLLAAAKARSPVSSGCRRTAGFGLGSGSAVPLPSPVFAVAGAGLRSGFRLRCHGSVHKRYSQERCAPLRVRTFMKRGCEMSSV